MRRFSFKILFSLLLPMTAAITNYPKDAFVSPVNRDIKLSGTFGELRSNHFHAGLDIRSQYGRTGDVIYAAAKGYVSRIQVNEYGYGNVLYIDHPTGYTTVYAHLDRFAPAIQEFVKKEQYKRESFEVNLFPAPYQFPVEQLDSIGILGNTGFSLGPHLHFEIRHSDTQTPINPLHFGFAVPDDIPPVIQQLIVYQYDDNGTMINSFVVQPKWQSKGTYTLASPIETDAARVSFSVRTIDYQTGGSNQNGIYSLSCHADEDPTFGFALDEISFQHTRYLNAHIDYRMKLYQNKYYHRCSPLEGNRLPIYFTGVDNGIVHVNPEISRKISIDVADFHNNISRIDFEVKRKNIAGIMAAPATNALVVGIPDQVTVLTQPGIQIVWPKNSFYERTPINMQMIPSNTSTDIAPHYELDPTDIPVHTYFDIAIDGLKVPAKYQEKAFIARCDADGSIVNCGARWIGNNLTTGARQMGTYTILIDTIPPSIRTNQFSSQMKGWKKMSFKISDNVRVRDKATDLRYTGRVDGKWILFALDGKSGTLTHEFDGTIAPGTHQLELLVMDDRGNVSVLEKTFTL